MIIVEKTKQGFTISGHADYDEEGRDIVCAAVSSLAQSVVITLERYNYRIDVDKMKGYLKVFIHNEDENTDIVMDVLFNGCLEMMREHPNHVLVDLNGYAV